MSSSECAPERVGDKQPSSPGEPSQPAKDADHSTSDVPDTSTRRLRKLIREKLRAQGREPPPSPPPPPMPYDVSPLTRELLDAGGEIIYERCSWLVKHACGTRVTKFNHDGIRPSEVEAMRFVSEHTSIPVPRVYDVGEKHFTMEFIEGETLDRAWDNTLSVEDRALVGRQLRDYINQLRAIKSPDDIICSFGGRPAVDSRRLFRHEGGPFANEAAYNDFLVSDLGGHSSIRDMIRTQMRADHEIVLSHGDLRAINIMARPGVGVVGIVDWELAGYYPEYLELLKLFLGANWECGYYRELLNIFPQRYDAEFVVDMVLTQWSRH